MEQVIAAPEDPEAGKAEMGLHRFPRCSPGCIVPPRDAFGGFVARRQQAADQLEFLDRMIDALSETGSVDPKNFYESPYTDIDSQGIVDALT